MQIGRWARKLVRRLRYGDYFGPLLDSIEDPGWFVPDIGGETSASNFAYTVGLWRTFGHPELLVMGLPQGVGGRLVNARGHLVKNGDRFQSGTIRHQLLTEYPAAFIDAPYERYGDYALSVEWFYGHHLEQEEPAPLMQLIWSSKTEPPRFPWDPDYPNDPYHEQILLGQPIHATSPAQNVSPVSQDASDAP